MITRNAIPIAAVVAVAISCAGAHGADSAATEAAKAKTTTDSSVKDAAQPPQSPGPATKASGDEKSEPLRIDVAFYTWLSSVSSEVDAPNGETSSDVPFKDILRSLDFANFMRLEVQRGKWGLFSEFDFIKLSNDTEFRRFYNNRVPITIHADGVLRETMIELGAIRSFDCSNVGFDVFGGARYFRLDSELSVGPLDIDVSQDWVDPLVGARFRVPLSDKWQASLRADVAGFGVGSELTTNAVATVTYSISDRYTIGFGYRYLDLNYDAKRVDLSTTTYGPIVGVIIRF